jgi:ribosomal protein L28
MKEESKGGKKGDIGRNHSDSKRDTKKLFT